VSETLGCADCGLRYGGPGWMDTHVPDDLWLALSPDGRGNGVLCITCMASRCEALGFEDVPLKITSGPFAGHYERLEALHKAAVQYGKHNPAPGGALADERAFFAALDALASAAAPAPGRGG
jgi:hypothetical protein